MVPNDVELNNVRMELIFKYVELNRSGGVDIGTKRCRIK